MNAQPMMDSYVHGYKGQENERLRDQAGALVELLHNDTTYPAGSRVREVGCGVGAQTLILARRSPGAHFSSIDISAEAIKEAEHKAAAAGLGNAKLEHAASFDLAYTAASFDHVFGSFVLETLA